MCVIQLSAPSAWIPTWDGMLVFNKHPLNEFDVSPEKEHPQEGINS